MQELFRLVNAGFPDDDGVAQNPGATIVSPYSAEGVGQIARDGPLAGHLAYAQVNLAADVGLTEGSQIGGGDRRARPGDRRPRGPCPGARRSARSSVPQTEFIGLAFAVVVLILAFGSVLAMGLPLAVAVAGVGAGVGADRAAQQLHHRARLLDHRSRS